MRLWSCWQYIHIENTVEPALPNLCIFRPLTTNDRLFVLIVLQRVGYPLQAQVRRRRAITSLNLPLHLPLGGWQNRWNRSALRRHRLSWGRRRSTQHQHSARPSVTVLVEVGRKICNKQECIPVGCVPPTAVAVGGGLHQAPPGTQVPPGSRPPQDQAPPPPPPPWEQTPPE